MLTSSPQSLGMSLPVMVTAVYQQLEDPNWPRGPHDGEALAQTVGRLGQQVKGGWLQHCGHLMRRTNSLEKTLKLGKIEGRRRRGRQRKRRLNGITDSMEMSLSKL